MNKTLVELSFTNVKEHAHNVWDYNRSGDNTSSQYLHNVIVDDYQLIPVDDYDMFIFYMDRGYEVVNNTSRKDKIPLKKSKHYCFTQETKKVLDELYSEVNKELQSSRERHVMTIDALDKAMDKVSKLEGDLYLVENASLFKRLKYLFTGGM